MKAVGARLPRYDGLGHVTGRTQFVDDVRVTKMLWAKALRSPVHHAAITRLDTSKAEQLPGVRAIVTCKDVPKNVYGHLEALGVPADEPLLADGEVRYRGQRLPCLLAAGVASGHHERLQVKLSHAAERTAPGQFACLYAGELVVGHGTIAA